MHCETSNMWGDPVRLKLPNSSIVVQTSSCGGR
jgi:hypothetical protein